MRFLLSLIFLAVFMVPAGAQKLPTAKEIGGIVFKEVEKRAIEEFFGKKAGKAAKDAGDDGDKKSKKAKKGKGKGKDKAKGKGRGKGLPPGLAKRDLPAGLKSKLPEPPPGLERIIAGDDVVLLEKATGKILDVIEGVLKGGK